MPRVDVYAHTQSYIISYNTLGVVLFTKPNYMYNFIQKKKKHVTLVIVAI